MRVTNATWDDVRIFGTAFIICVLIFAVFKLIAIAFSSSERKAVKYGSPRNFIGYFFFELTKRGLEMLGETYSDTSWKFMLYKAGKNNYAIDFDIQYEPNNIKIMMTLKIDNTKEFKTLTCPYDQKTIHGQILSAMESLLLSHKDFQTLK